MDMSSQLVDIHKKMQPIGNILQANDSLPVMDSFGLVHFFETLNEQVVVSNDDFYSEKILTLIVIVSSTMPRNTRHVVGPFTFLVLIGVPILLQSDNIWDKFCRHALELGGLLV